MIECILGIICASLSIAVAEIAHINYSRYKKELKETFEHANRSIEGIKHINASIEENSYAVQNRIYDLQAPLYDKNRITRY